MAEVTRTRLAGGAESAGRHQAEGIRLAAAGRLEAALEAFRAALALAPRDPELHTNLGNVLLGLGRHELAQTAYRQALALGLDHPLVHYNLGTALRAGGRAEEALAAFLAALEGAPDFAPAHNNRGNALRDLGRHAQAAAAYLEALALRPDQAGTRVNLSSVLSLLHAQDAAAAAALAERWREAHPGDPMARHVAAAMGGGPPPPRAEDGYVRQLFDGFAADFDRKLAELDYRVPGLIAAALERLWPPPRPEPPGLLVLDAGCGTGLMAAALRPLARTLTGVDLSGAMLERARELGLYDGVEQADLATCLAVNPNAFDLIVAADVLCYFGALETLLADAAAALRPGGRLIFTVERDLAPDAPPYRLQANGRYRHASAAVISAVTAAGLPPASATPVTLRREQDLDVPGLLVEAQKPPIR